MPDKCAIPLRIRAEPNDNDNNDLEPYHPCVCLRHCGEEHGLTSIMIDWIIGALVVAGGLFGSGNKRSQSSTYNMPRIDVGEPRRDAEKDMLAKDDAAEKRWNDKQNAIGAEQRAPGFLK